MVWGLCGWESPSLLLPPVVGLVGGKGSVWGLVGGNPPASPCGVGFGGVEFVLVSLGGLVVVVKLL